ncbi:isopenicillin N synthase family dioxygenase [Paenirhodobacter sp.]|uniref:isopenicillin N synthase family dioxygenase n=1 Tax=Paenirhodobacter sp. TaxID=1965326 RepID=UPI003B3E302D
MTLTARSVSAAALPVIDVAGLSSADPAAREAVGRALRAACLDKGFFYATGHGVPQGLIDAVFAESKAFFDQPPEAKARIDKAHSFCNRGYEPMRGQALDPTAPADLKEGFYIGPELPMDDPRVVARRFNRGPNQWPEDLPGFRPVMRAYFAAMQDLGERLMRGMALSLALPEDHFATFCKDPLITLRLLHYPPQPAKAAENEMGAGAHTDFGGLTLLLQDTVGGLQVFDAASGAWIHAQPVPGAFVVNLGDMIQRWTNGRYRSTLHRVVNASGRERYSVPFFYTGNPDVVVESLDPSEPAKFPPITVEDHLREMYAHTYAVAQKA